MILDDFIFIFMFFIQWSLEKQLGETCGPCFNPDTNYDCGKCANNLACQPGNPQLPDQPGSCVKEEDFKGKTKQIIPTNIWVLSNIRGALQSSINFLQITSHKQGLNRH